ncbi:hypothetical protein VPH35_025274 [Triticum aestivum]
MQQVYMSDYNTGRRREHVRLILFLLRAAWRRRGSYRGVTRARSGLFITLKNPSSSVRSTPPLAGGSHSNSRTSAATKLLTCMVASPPPGHALCPAPNGIILISLRLGPGTRPTPSPSPPARKRSGRNASGSVHAFLSLPISPRLKCARIPSVGTAAAAHPRISATA